MKSCWKFSPDERATFCLLVELLNQYRGECQSIESDEYRAVTII